MFSSSLDEPKDVLSNVEKNGEWKTRPIDLWGLLKSFISQLKVGEQITKISLPAEMCYPYSMLEMVAYRQLSLFKALYGINEETDGLKRMLIVLKYFACLPKNETHNKKPWNPILGETHMARVVDDQNGPTEFMSEQVSHHPPVSAFHVRNDKQQFEISSNLGFQVKFSGNSASISVNGPSTLKANKLGEVYEFSRCMPAMLVRNLVLGTKYIVWEGDCVISCPQTGYEAKVSFKEGWTRNSIMSGTVYHASEPKKTLYSFDGNCGSEIKVTPKGSNVPEKSKFTLVNVADQVSDKLSYLPPDKLEPMSSVMVWGPVNAGVLQHNTILADEEKFFVEQEQRRMRQVRADAGKEFEGQYFIQQGERWVIRDGVTLSKLLSGEIPTVPMSSYSARGDHLRKTEEENFSMSDDPGPHVVRPVVPDSDPNIQEALANAKIDPVDADHAPAPTPSATPVPSRNAPEQGPVDAIPMDSSIAPPAST